MRLFPSLGLLVFLLLLANIKLNEAGEPVTVAITVFQIFQFLKDRIGEYNDIKDYFENIKEQNDKTLSDVKEAVDELKKDIHSLKQSVENKHFNSQVKYPMKKVFYQFHKFIELPSNTTKHALESQCTLHPPLSTLEALYDCLEDNWLIKVARHYGFKSDKVEKLTLMLDKYITALIISQAACSGLSSRKEEARYDLKKLQPLLQRVSSVFNKSMAVVHKEYFQFTKKIIPNFLPDEISSDWFINDRRRKQNYELALKILHHFEKHYNYGVRYSIRVGQEDYREFFGTLNESFYQVSHGGFKVLVIQIAPFKAEYNKVLSETKKRIDATTNLISYYIQRICLKYISKCCSDHLLLDTLQRICKEKVACFFAYRRDSLKSFYVFSRNTDIQAANGLFTFWNNDAIYEIRGDEIEFFISPAIPSNHIFKRLPNEHHNFLNIKESSRDAYHNFYFVKENNHFLKWIDAVLNDVKQKEWSEKHYDNSTNLFVETGMFVNVRDFMVDSK